MERSDRRPRAPNPPNAGKVRRRGGLPHPASEVRAGRSKCAVPTPALKRCASRGVGSRVALRLPGGRGSTFKRDVKSLVDRLKKEIPQLFESQEYLNMKKERKFVF